MRLNNSTDVDVQHPLIVIVGKTPFPVNTASSNRILTLSKGMINAGATVHVYVFGLSRLPLRCEGNNYSGSFSGIKWMFFNKRVTAFNCRFLNGIYLILGQIKGYTILLFRYFNKKPFFFTSQTEIGYIIPLWILTRICRGRIILFRSEFPAHILRKNSITWLVENYFYPIAISRFDAMFFMTDKLREYFEKWANKNAVIEIVPLSVDLIMFDYPTQSPFLFSYIAYSGSITNAKDGLYPLIRSFYSIHKTFPDVHLVIIGGGSDLNALKAYVADKFNEEGKVVFTGIVDHSKVPEYLLNAKILALARPNSIQAEGGFPTKLGEYLATGRPVIVTDTGEISKYLKDKVNARIVKAGDESDFTEKLMWMLENPEESCKIGIKGRETAINNFDMNKIGFNILKILKRLN